MSRDHVCCEIKLNSIEVLAIHKQWIKWQAYRAEEWCPTRLSAATSANQYWQCYADDLETLLNKPPWDAGSLSEHMNTIFSLLKDSITHPLHLHNGEKQL